MLFSAPRAHRAGVCFPGGATCCGGGECSGGLVGAPEGGETPLGAGGAKNHPEAATAGLINPAPGELARPTGGAPPPPAAGGNGNNIIF